MTRHCTTGACLLLVCGLAGAGEGQWDELIRRGEQLCEHGKFGEAEGVLLAALDEAKGFPSPDLRAAVTMQHLGTVYRELGRLPEAEKWYRRSLSTWEQSVDEAGPSLATPVINLAALYLETGLHAKADRLMEPLLREPARRLRLTDARSVRLLHNLAAIQHRQGRHSMAETLYRETLIAAEQVFGPNDQDVALVLNNFALLLADAGKAGTSGPYLERALAIREKLGRDHPHVGRALANLAVFHSRHGDRSKAEPLFQRRWPLPRGALGPRTGWWA